MSEQRDLNAQETPSPPGAEPTGPGVVEEPAAEVPEAFAPGSGAPGPGVAGSGETGDPTGFPAPSLAGDGAGPLVAGAMPAEPTGAVDLGPEDLAAAPLTEEEDDYEQLLEDLQRLHAEREDYLDQLLRTRADFENYRKRMLRQQGEILERATEELVARLLEVLDVFDAAVVHGQGFDQAYARLVAVLAKEGLARIEPVGAPFDPNEADAVDHEAGENGPVVSEVLRPGYRWKGRVLRPAMVKVKG